MCDCSLPITDCLGRQLVVTRYCSVAKVLVWCESLKVTEKMPQTDAGLIISAGHSPQHDKIPLEDVLLCRARRNSSQLSITILNVALRSLHRVKAEESTCFLPPIAIACPATPNNLEKITSSVGQKLTSSKDKSVVLPARKFVTKSSKVASSFASNKPAVGSWQKFSPKSDSQGTEEKKGKYEKTREVTRADSSTELASTTRSLIWQVVLQHKQEPRTILHELSSASPRPRDPATISETCSLDEESTRHDGRHEPKASIHTEHRIAAAARCAKHFVTSVIMDVSRAVTDANINSISTAESTYANTANQDSPKYTKAHLNASDNTVLTSVYVARAPDAVSRDSRFISATFVLDVSLLAPLQLKSQSQPHLIPSRELSSTREESPAQKARRHYTQRKFISKPSPCQCTTETGKASRTRTKSLPALSKPACSTDFKEDAVVQQSRETEKSLFPRASRLPRVKGKVSADSLQGGDALTSATKCTTRTSSPAASAASHQSDAKQRLIELQRKDETKKSPLQRITKLPQVSRPVSIGSASDAVIFATPRRSAAESVRLLASSSNTYHPTSPSYCHLDRPWSCESMTPASKSARTSRLPHAVGKYF